MKLRIIPLGGMGNVTQNMYLYEYGEEIMIVDCGIGFPDLYMPGVDSLIPDISYLLEQLENGKNIVGMVLTHGHDDHIAATPYILPQLPEFPIYGSSLTAGFAQNRMTDGGLNHTVTVVRDREEVQIGQYFKIELIPVTHSVPDTRHIVIRTPEGIIYHGSDFKFDPSPVDGHPSDLERIAQIGKEGVLCALVDSLRVERDEWVKSESTTGPAIEREMASTKGTFIITMMSSHIHRIQQTINTAHKHGRKVVFVGRSVEQNVEIATKLEELKIPKGMQIDKRDMGQFKPGELCVFVAGSQGQEGSSLMRAIYGEHPVMQIKQEDKVVFSADAIPGNEIPYFQAIDELCRNGIEVVYPDIVPDLHQSGHASAPEQQELVSLVKAKYLMPIGGADRHRVKFVEFVAAPQGYRPEQVLIPAHGQVVEFSNGKAQAGETIPLQTITVDGLGVGDVGPVVLSDRRSLSEAGVIVLVIPREGKDSLDLRNMQVISRGFVFMKKADEVVQFIKKATAEIITDLLKQHQSEAQLKQALERRLARRLDKVIKRSPMILTVLV